MMNRAEKKAAVADVQKVFNKLVRKWGELQQLKTKPVERVEFSCYDTSAVILFQKGQWCCPGRGVTETDIMKMSGSDWESTSSAAYLLELITEEQLEAVNGVRREALRRLQNANGLEHLRQRAEDSGYTLVKKKRKKND